ncbi:MAG: hypothetical protein RL755_854 [Pseudomonadota bacterium]|jgi:hypothetical protein
MSKKKEPASTKHDKKHDKNHDKHDKKVALVKMPSFSTMLFGAIAAYWLSTIMNPAFVAIGVLVILLIPIVTVDNIFARQFAKAYQRPETQETENESKPADDKKAKKPEVKKVATAPAKAVEAKATNKK